MFVSCAHQRTRRSGVGDLPRAPAHLGCLPLCHSRAHRRRRSPPAHRTTCPGLRGVISRWKPRSGPSIRVAHHPSPAARRPCVCLCALCAGSFVIRFFARYGIGSLVICLVALAHHHPSSWNPGQLSSFPLTACCFFRHVLQSLSSRMHQQPHMISQPGTGPSCPAPTHNHAQGGARCPSPLPSRRDCCQCCCCCCCCFCDRRAGQSLLASGMKPHCPGVGEWVSAGG